MRVVITARAERDLDAHIAYMLERDPEAAARMADAILAQLMTLAEFPFRTRPGRVPGTRELVIAGYPYIAVFEVGANEVVILHINHVRQQ